MWVREFGQRHLRRPGTTLFALTCLAIVLAVALPALWQDTGAARRDEPLLDRLSAWIGFGPIVWAIWQFGVAPRVVLNDSGVTIVNPIFRYEAPWSTVAGIGSDDVAIQLNDGRTIRAFAFSESMLADLTGDRVVRRARKLMRGAHDEHRDLYDPLTRARRVFRPGLIWFTFSSLLWCGGAYVAYMAHRP